MDFPALNSLIDGIRFSSEDIEQAMITCCDFYNCTAPIMMMSQYTVEKFPYRYIMLIWVAGHLLKSAAINQASNQLDYSADGISVADNNKAQLFMDMGNQFQAEAKQLVKDAKISMNVMGAYGGKASEFAWLVR